MNWYDQLNKSQLTPPDSWFGIVWPILYTLMAISLGIVLFKFLCLINGTELRDSTRCYLEYRRRRVKTPYNSHGFI